MQVWALPGRLSLSTVLVRCELNCVNFSLDAVDGEPLNDEVPGAAEGQGQSQWM